MRFLEILINIVVACVGIFITGLGLGYIVWFHAYIADLNPIVNVINIALVTCGYVIPAVAIIGIGMGLFLKSLMDPIEL